MKDNYLKPQVDVVKFNEVQGPDLIDVSPVDEGFTPGDEFFGLDDGME